MLALCPSLGFKIYVKYKNVYNIWKLPLVTFMYIVRITVRTI